ncbi:hypothetical protein SAY87_008473 [Trapa incisa]|uniref:VDE lipocalin domain-containing protein n=1 Tax=Trapa incisa TaxID=236973 RepID=A0AAN7QG18_9MYRT|nr:hypothetical protein SAY87_008473 [Trapa incisa]
MSLEAPSWNSCLRSYRRPLPNSAVFSGGPRSFSLSRRRTARFTAPLLLCRNGSFSGIVSTTKAVLETEDDAATEFKSPPVRIVAIVGEGSVSPLKQAPWSEVMLHTATRMKWMDEDFEMRVFSDASCGTDDDQEENNLRHKLMQADILIVVAVMNQGSAVWIKNISEKIPNVISFDSSPSLSNKLGGSLIRTSTSGTFFSQLLEPREPIEVVETVTEAWARRNSDDIRFCLLVIINAYVRPVPILKNLRSKGLSTLNCMVKNCGPQILDCLLDPNCRKALQCLNNCSPVDQVCNYRCIASYESPKLEAFSLCVLQKHNCLELDAQIPQLPVVPQMRIFRGEEITHEVAEDLFVGWLGKLDWSWRVVAGQNPAYDQFPCQYQLLYRGRAKGSFWYEPVFQVRTLEGKMVWRRRKYRVKRAAIPGTFFFSVLDNGVTSNEYWTVVDVSDDLSWGLFHYRGAARAAGQSYTGAVLVSPDGKYPDESQRGRLALSLEKCGIKEWELFNVDNCSCVDPPLGIPEESRLHSVIRIQDKKSVSSQMG